MTNAEAIHVINQVRNIITKNPSWMEEATRVVNEAADMAIKALEAQEWVPVSERLPEEGRDVLFCDIDKYIMIGHHTKGKLDTHFSQQGTYERIKNVKAWMPLPEPYRESEDKE